MSTKDSSRAWTKKEIRQVVREDSISIGTLVLHLLFMVWIGSMVLLALEARLNRLEGGAKLNRVETPPFAPWNWPDYREKYPRPPEQQK